jgi:hypothetical protein
MQKFAKKMLILIENMQDYYGVSIACLNLITYLYAWKFHPSNFLSLKIIFYTLQLSK